MGARAVMTAEAEAADLGPAEKPKRVKQRGLERFTVLEDGAISNPKVERFALLVADGVGEAPAFRMVGYSDQTGYGKDWYRRIKRDPVVRARIDAVMAERMAAAGSESPFAMARYTASQLWRDARAAGDMVAATKASELLFKIGQQEVAYAAAGGGPALPGEVPAASRGPGRPPVELQQTKTRSIDELKRDLLERKA